MDRKHEFRGLVQEWLNCERCELHKSRNNVVFARGSFDPYILFVGEAPGADEDEKGRPFIGQSGQLLDELIEEAGIERGTYAIMNVVGCRPPRNREPTIFEIRACKRRFDTLLKILKPQVIVVMGRTAAKKVIGVQSISKWRGGLIDADLLVGRDIIVYKSVVTYHPSYLLRSGKNGPLRKSMINDLKVARQAMRVSIGDEDE